MMKPGIILILTLIMAVASASSREITLYRTIDGEYATLEAAQQNVSPASDIVEQDGKYYVVSGLYDKFQDALPENPTHSAWNTSWKHVLPVITTVDDARQRGFTVPETLTRQAVSKPEFAAIPANKSLANLLRSTTTRIETMEAGKAKPENELRRDMIAVLEPQLSNFIAVAERSTDREDAAFAQYWVAKTCYLQGVDLSVQRLPKTSFNQERHAWAEEELCYDSAMEAIDTYLERFPNTGKTEEVAYLKAATSYHLTYRGHHRHQVELAKQAYQDFIDQYPKSERVPRAKMNLLGIALEIARMEMSGFEEVITIGEDLLSQHPNANDYVKSRAMIIVAEAYYDGFRKYETVKTLCDEIITEFATKPEGTSVLSTAFRLKAHAHLMTKEYDEAASHFSMFLDFYTSEQFHFGYQWEEEVAAAYYWRGRSLLNLKQYGLAKTDFETTINKYPNNYFAEVSKIYLNRIQIQKENGE